MGLSPYIVSWTKHQLDERHALVTPSLPCFTPQPSNRRIIIQIVHCKKYQISLTRICQKPVIQTYDESMENELECQIIALMIYACSEYGAKKGKMHYFLMLSLLHARPVIMRSH